VRSGEVVTSVEVERQLRAHYVVVSAACRFDTAEAAEPEASRWIDLYCGRPAGLTSSAVTWAKTSWGKKPAGRDWLDELVCREPGPAAAQAEVDAVKRRLDAETSKPKSKEREEAVVRLKRDLDDANASLARAVAHAQATSHYRVQCESHKQVSAAVAAAAPVLAAVVGGLGDFLKDRAKQELVAYALETLGREVCKADGKVRNTLQVGGQFVLNESCKVAFPSGSELDYASVSDGRFQHVFRKELEALPPKLAHIALEKVVSGNATVPKAMVTALFQELSPLLRGVSVSLGGLLGRVDADVKASGVVAECKLGQGGTFGHDCVSLLGLRVASTTERLMAEGKPMLDLKRVLEESGRSFCQDYGQGGSMDLSCLGVSELDAAKLIASANTWASQQTIGRSNALLDESVQLDATELLRGMMALAQRVHLGIGALERLEAVSDEKQKRELIVSALREMVLPTFRFAKKLSEGNDRVVGVLELAFDASLALLAQDLASLRATLKMLVALPELKTALGDKGVRSVHFALDIGTAADSEEAKKVFEAVAEPLGSYRAKYDADFTFSVNGLVGSQLRGIAWLDTGARVRESSTVGFDPRPLTAPVGLDLSWRCGRQHFGVFVSALDPLGMVVLEAEGEEAVRVDWGGVVTPGLFARWGIQKSPIVLFAGAQWLPLRRPEAELGQGESGATSARGYDGAITFGGGFGVDIPILFIAQE